MRIKLNRLSICLAWLCAACSGNGEHPQSEQAAVQVAAPQTSEATVLAALERIVARVDGPPERQPSWNELVQARKLCAEYPREGAARARILVMAAVLNKELKKRVDSQLPVYTGIYAARRKTFARHVEERLLRQDLDVHVNAAGERADVLILSCDCWTRPSVFQFGIDGGFDLAAFEQGFVEVRYVNDAERWVSKAGTAEFLDDVVAGREMGMPEYDELDRELADVGARLSSKAAH